VASEAVVEVATLAAWVAEVATTLAAEEVATLAAWVAEVATTRVEVGVVAGISAT
jgi:hypothetical protein